MLAANLTQADSGLNRLRAEVAQNQQEETRLEARISGDEAEVQQLTEQIEGLQAQSKRLTAREREERAGIASMARAINEEPASALASVVEAGSLGSYLTQDAVLDGAAQRAHQLTRQLDSTRRRLRASQRSLTQKGNRVRSDEDQARESQEQLELLASRLGSQEAQLQAQTSTTQSEIATAQQAAEQQGGSLSDLQAARLSAMGTGGLDQQALAAGLASSLYTLSASSLRWPAQPDPSPLGLTAYPGYCRYTPIQCTCYAANAYQAYTQGVLPQNLGNAGQWIGGAQAANIPTTQTPAEGALVVFNGPGYSVNGHVAIVRSVILSAGSAIGLVVWKRNLDEAGSFDVRLVALGSGSEIIGYIAPGRLRLVGAVSVRSIAPGVPGPGCASETSPVTAVPWWVGEAESGWGPSVAPAFFLPPARARESCGEGPAASPPGRTVPRRAASPLDLRAGSRTWWWTGYCLHERDAAQITPTQVARSRAETGRDPALASDARARAGRRCRRRRPAAGAGGSPRLSPWRRCGPDPPSRTRPGTGSHAPGTGGQGPTDRVADAHAQAAECERLTGSPRPAPAVPARQCPAGSGESACQAEGTGRQAPVSA